jgi:hypothetical protein
MGFELRVTFTGLCLFLIREDCKRVAVLQPDARVGGRLSRFHPDGEPVVHHAGYLRFDLANLSAGSSAPFPVTNPLNEGVHHFRWEELKFGIPDVDTGMAIQTGLPAMERVAPHPLGPAPMDQELECPSGERSRLQLMSGLFGTAAPLAMRTILSGGTLKKSDSKSAWAFLPYALTPGGLAYAGEFATEVMWTRVVEDRDSLDLSITPFAGGPAQTLTLHPTMTGTGAVLLLKIANLCSDNPLEWVEFPTPPPAREDRDFKWFYQLFRDAAGNPVTGMVPVPILQPGGLGVENCIGLRATVTSFT